MNSQSVNIIRFELKYCERCGGLWLRRHGSEAIYCPGCAIKMADFPAVRRRPARKIRRKPFSTQASARPEEGGPR